MRRAEVGLPRLNRLTDICNAISVKHQVPLDGEVLDKYDESPFLSFLSWATGQEQFVTLSSGDQNVELAAPGEPIRCDDTGTCRRWNWRQGPWTTLTDENALYTRRTRAAFAGCSGASCRRANLGARISLARSEEPTPGSWLCIFNPP